MNKSNKLNLDAEDIEDALKVVEKSYNIQFANRELAHVKTFGELCDSIITKIDLADKEDCTSQQAFYKLRDAVVATKDLDKSSIKTYSGLNFVFPRKYRRREVGEIERHLGFRLDALRPRSFVTFALGIVLVGSFFWLFVNWKYGLLGIILSIAFLNIAQLTGKEFKHKTVGELSDHMARRNYLKSRRNSNTINKREVQGKIEQLFIEELGLSEEEIKRETLIV